MMGSRLACLGCAMNMNRRILTVSVTLAAGLFLTGCDDPENEDTLDPAETSIQQDQEGDGDGAQDDDQGGDQDGEQGGGDD